MDNKYFVLISTIFDENLSLYLSIFFSKISVVNSCGKSVLIPFVVCRHQVLFQHRRRYRRHRVFRHPLRPAVFQQELGME